MIKLLDIINESLNTAKKKYLQTNKISTSDFDELLTIDKTESKKYIDKLCQYFVNGTSTDDLNLYINKFDTLASKGIIKDKDINSYKTFNELKSIVDENSNKKTNNETKIEIKSNEAKKIYEDDRYLVIMPLTKNASCIYGKGTKWCISGDESNYYWNDYTKHRLMRFYFIIDKQLTISDELYKIGLAMYPNDTIECFDAPDKPINFNKYIKTTTIPKSIFKYIEYNDDEKSFSCIDGTYEIVNGLVNVKGNVKLRKTVKLTFKFGIVTGYFDCSFSGLTSLEGAPKTVGGRFDCSANNLTSLKGCPKNVGGGFYCSDNKLTSLEGCPKNIGEGFDCSFNELTSLEGCPKNVGSGRFDCSANNLTSLKGCPKNVGGVFNCKKNLTKFTEEDVRKLCKVADTIYC